MDPLQLLKGFPEISFVDEMDDELFVAAGHLSELDALIDLSMVDQDLHDRFRVQVSFHLPHKVPELFFEDLHLHLFGLPVDLDLVICLLLSKATELAGIWIKDGSV